MKLIALLLLGLLGACSTVGSGMSTDARLSLLPPDTIAQSKLVTFHNNGPQTAVLSGVAPIVGVHEVKPGETLVVRWDGKEYLTSIQGDRP